MSIELASLIREDIFSWLTGVFFISFSYWVFNSWYLVFCSSGRALIFCSISGQVVAFIVLIIVFFTLSLWEMYSCSPKAPVGIDERSESQRGLSVVRLFLVSYLELVAHSVFLLL